MKKQNQAFTLVELIVVITILAILGTIAFISLQGYSAQARDTTRVSDINNIKKSLELFSLNTGKYPEPDVGYDVTYDTDLVWIQGIVGDNVTTNLSRNLNSKLVDPLTELEYTYSVIGSQTQYELLSIYESDLISYNILNQTNAAEQAYPKIDGTYNGVFVKTDNYYIPTPSIINAELNGIGGILGVGNIDSQIITGGENNIANGTSEVKINQLPKLNLSVYDGTILDNDTKKTDLGLAIQAAYTGSELANTGIYKSILEIPEDELVTLINNVVLGGDLVSSAGGETITLSCDESTKPADDLNKIYTVNPISVNQAYEKDSDECGYSCDGLFTGINCEIAPLTYKEQGLCNDSDIYIPDGCIEGTEGCYVIASCNLGATTASTDWNISGGEYFQWGRNKGFTYSDSSQESTQIANVSYDLNNDTDGFVWNTTLDRSDWIENQDDNLWGDNLGLGTDIQRKGPCPSGYHIPTKLEWGGIVNAGDGIYWDIVGSITEGTDMKNKLKLPVSGFRYHTEGLMHDEGNTGRYWSSTPYTENANNMYFSSTQIVSGTNLARAIGISIRCFKD